ncbi:MAG: DASS family sodium-coupled anion symporter [Acidobacteriota bacterium]|jgi:sodium-dependent dicarboxylate transporter 2/3/5|nr:DASS family sodium-coupled anion symporter [Acidobacteriota bacterium]
MRLPGAPFGKYIGFFGGLAVFGVMRFAMSVPVGMTRGAWDVACVTALMAVWWITEAVPIPATGLIPIFAFPALGVMSPKDAAAPYASDVIYLFMGGFFLAVTMEKWNLHRWIALHTIKVVGMSPSRLVLGFMAATAFLSMWVSNSATAMMMVPIGLAVVGEVTGLGAAQIKAGGQAGSNPDLNFGRALMLGVAYAASIGGLATIIGTPPNAILVGVVRQMYGYEITFGQWMLFGCPLAAVTLLATWFILCRLQFPTKGFGRGRADGVIDGELARLGPLSRPAAAVLAVAGLMAVAWIARGFVAKPLGLDHIDDSTIAIGGALLLFALPVDLKKREFLLDWRTAVTIPWDVVLLFGGGLAIAHGFAVTGLTQYAADAFGDLRGVHAYVFMSLVVVFTILLTEVTSNTATATLMVPLMGTVGVALGMNPLGPMLAAAVAASYAFMFPVATPPNAVAYGSGCFSIRDMALAGVWINLVSFVLIPAAVYLLLPLFWGQPLDALPSWLPGAGPPSGR